MKCKRKRKRSKDDDKYNTSRCQNIADADESPTCDDNESDHQKRASLKNHSTGNAKKNEFDMKRTAEIKQKMNDHPNYQYILAPMVGASELPFRLLCRKYGTQLCYTPMMSSQLFSTSAEYRKDYFGSSTTNSNSITERVHFADHPVYAHVYANTVEDFVAAAKQALIMNCDGIDLNLGCPQRTAYIGQYGSYLCTDNPQTHDHISDMISAAVRGVQNKIPVTAKIRLLHATDTQSTINLCRTLYNNHQGATLIAIHARERASWERTGPSARDGPANLHQVAQIVQDVRKKRSDDCTTSTNQKTEKRRLRIVTNGNTTTYDDVVQNLDLTKADGIMSAEGLLDNPALYLPRYYNNDPATTVNLDCIYVSVWTLKEEYRYKYCNYQTFNAKSSMSNTDDNDTDHKVARKIQLIQSKIRKIEVKLQSIHEQQHPITGTYADQLQIKHDRCRTKREKLQKKLQKLRQTTIGTKQHTQRTLMSDDDDINGTVDSTNGRNCNCDSSLHSMSRADTEQIDPHIEYRTVTVQSLLSIASDKILLGMEYLDWATVYPTTIRTTVFHIRRMCKGELVQYQLLQSCLQAITIDAIRDILNRIIQYRISPETFNYDSQRAQDEKDALARQKYEEGKRKAYEERMIRKAKREKIDDLFYYLSIGAELPTPQQMEYYHTLDRDTLNPIWKQHHSQHCISYHIDQCQRGRACAFLHTDLSTSSKVTLQEKDECAG